MVKRKRRKGAPKISGPKTHKVQSGNQSSVEEVKTGTDYGKKNTIFKPNEKKTLKMSLWQRIPLCKTIITPTSLWVRDGEA